MRYTKLWKTCTEKKEVSQVTHIMHFFPCFLMTSVIDRRLYFPPNEYSVAQDCRRTRRPWTQSTIDTLFSPDDCRRAPVSLVVLSGAAAQSD